MSSQEVIPPLRSRFFAKMWSRMAPSVDQQFAHHKDDVLVDLPDRIVELGPGLGSNFGRFPEGAEVIGFEPNVAMHPGLTAEAEQYGIKLDIRSEDFRTAGLPSDSEDVVVSTLVLCSVGDQAAMVAEIKRVLRPGGRLLFIEHVASENGLLHGFQRVIRRPWSAVGDGCDPAAPTVSVMEDAGFSSLVVESGKVGPVVDPTHPACWGTAVK